MLRYFTAGIIAVLYGCSAQPEAKLDEVPELKEPPKCSYTVFNVGGHWGYDTYIGDSLSSHVVHLINGRDTTYLKSFNEADSCGNAFCDRFTLNQQAAL